MKVFEDGDEVLDVVLVVVEVDGEAEVSVADRSDDVPVSQRAEHVGWMETVETPNGSANYRTATRSSIRATSVGTVPV